MAEPMSEQYLEKKGYGSRWAVESFFSGLTRTMGSTFTSRKPSHLLAEAAFKVLAYTLRRKPSLCSHQCFQPSKPVSKFKFRSSLVIFGHLWSCAIVGYLPQTLPA